MISITAAETGEDRNAFDMDWIWKSTGGSTGRPRPGEDRNRVADTYSTPPSALSIH